MRRSYLSSGSRLVVVVVVVVTVGVVRVGHGCLGPLVPKKPETMAKKPVGAESECSVSSQSSGGDVVELDELDVDDEGSVVVELEELVVLDVLEELVVVNSAGLVVVELLLGVSHPLFQMADPSGQFLPPVTPDIGGMMSPSCPSCPFKPFTLIVIWL